MIAKYVDLARRSIGMGPAFVLDPKALAKELADLRKWVAENQGATEHQLVPWPGGCANCFDLTLPAAGDTRIFCGVQTAIGMPIEVMSTAMFERYNSHVLEVLEFLCRPVCSDAKITTAIANVKKARLLYKQSRALLKKSGLPRLAVTQLKMEEKL